MQIGAYVIYELLVRLQEQDPAVGDYVGNKITGNGVLVNTTTGLITMPHDILLRQFNDPTSITQHEILNLLDSFK